VTDPHAQLHAVGTEPAGKPCNGTYTCDCPACRAEVQRRLDQGVRLRGTPVPLKRAA
jgi:hypothetical protein